jgi:hypothetical protein
MYQVIDGNNRTCMPCSRGNYCPGGERRPANITDDAIGGFEVACGDHLTTKSERSTRLADCVALAGWVLPTTVGGAAMQCTGSTYSPPYNRLKTCLPCQSGLQAPPGYFGLHIDRTKVCREHFTCRVHAH